MIGNRRWLLGLLGLTFLAGLAAGVWGERALFSTAVASSSSQKSRHRKNWHSRSLERLSQRLQLSDDQRARVIAVYKKKREGYQEVFEPIRPRLKEFREASRKEIRASMRPDQIPEYERICREEDERFSAWGKKDKIKRNLNKENDQ